jgi:hypothetical protein
VYTEVWWGNLKDPRDHLEDLGEECRIIRWIFRKWVGGIDWIEPVQDMDGWRALVNVVTNFRVP